MFPVVPCKGVCLTILSICGLMDHDEDTYTHRILAALECDTCFRHIVVYVSILCADTAIARLEVAVLKAFIGDEIEDNRSAVTA